MPYISETYLTVRYAETDMMGIVHHSRYYPWFEQARTDWILETGLTYSAMEQMGIMLPLTETHCRYYYGLKYEDEVLVTCKPEKLTVARVEFSYKVYKMPERKLMSEGRTMHGFADSDLSPINLKKKFPDVWDRLTELME